MCAIERRYISAACRRGLALGLLLFGVSLASLTIADDIWDLIYYDINEIKYNTIDILYGISSLMSGANSNAYEIINMLEEISSQTDIWDLIYYDIDEIKQRIWSIDGGVYSVWSEINQGHEAIINMLEEISSQTFDVFVVNWQDQYDDNDFADDITRTVDYINDQLDDLIVALEQNIGELQLQLELEFDSLSWDMGQVIDYLGLIHWNTYSTLTEIQNLSRGGLENIISGNIDNLLSGLEGIMPGGSEDIIDVFDEWDNELSYYDPPNLYEPELDEFSSVSGIVKSAAGAYRSVHVDALEYEMEGQSALDDIEFSGDFEDQTLLENIRGVIDKIMPLDVEISSMYWSLEIPDGVSIFGDAEVINLVDVSASDLQGLSVVRSVSGLIYVALGIFVLVRGLR